MPSALARTPYDEFPYPSFPLPQARQAVDGHAAREIEPRTRRRAGIAGLGSGVGGSLRQRPAPGPAGRCCRWTLCRTTLLMSPARWQNAFYVYYAQ